MRTSTLVPRAAALLLCILVLGGSAPSQDDVLARVEAGLEEADAEGVLTDAPDRVEIVLLSLIHI